MICCKADKQQAHMKILLLSKDNLTDKNQSFIDNFLSKDDLTGKNQSFFDYFLSKDNLTGKNQRFFDYLWFYIWTDYKIMRWRGIQEIELGNRITK